MPITDIAGSILKIKILRLVVAITLGVASAGIVQHDAPSALANSVGTSLYTPAASNEAVAYDRLIRLAHSTNPARPNGTLLATFEHWTTDGTAASFLIEKSADDGKSWTQIATVGDGETGTGHPWSHMYQPFLFEFPSALGAYPAGTLLLVGNVLPPDSSVTHFEEWRSTDQGSTWGYVSTFQTGGGLSPGRGIWEPFLALDKSGNLICYFSDERQYNTYSQFLGHITSTDGGATWGSSEAMDVASTTQADRPGMATIATLPNNTYIMSFEICGPHNCEAHVKMSADADTWGTGAADLGTLVQTSDGRTLHSSPYIAWSPAGGSNGEVLLAAYNIWLSNGSLAPETRAAIFVNTNLGAGSWAEAPAPYTPAAGACSSANYSPALLVSQTGNSVRLMAPSNHGSSGQCEERTDSANAGILPYSAPFAGGTDAGWDTYGGSWSVSNGIYTDQSSATNGDKSVAGSTAWTDYTLQGDVRLTASNNAGFLVRVTNPAVGADSHNGYFVGFDSGNGNLFIGKESYNWTYLQGVAMPGGVSLNTWYHVTVQAVGCTFTVAAQVVGSTGTPTEFSATDTGCSFTSGLIGVRTWNANAAAWRNISVTPGGSTSTAVAPYYAPFAAGTATGWTTYGGTWLDSGVQETFGETSSSTNGDKAIAGSSSWGDYTLQSDVQLTAAGNSGILVRVNNPAVGPDALQGYFVGLDSGNGNVFLGRQNNNWTYLAGTAMPGGVSLNTWHHLTVQAVGCTFTVSAQASGTADQSTFTYTDAGCTFTAGKIGVRTWNPAASFRNVEMAPR